jgi:hypothetical protein
MQPLDVGCFGPLSHAYSQVLEVMQSSLPLATAITKADSGAYLKLRLLLLLAILLAHLLLVGTTPLLLRRFLAASQNQTRL